MEILASLEILVNGLPPTLLILDILIIRHMHMQELPNLGSHALRLGKPRNIWRHRTGSIKHAPILAPVHIIDLSPQVE